MSNNKCWCCLREGHQGHECPKEEKDWEIYCYDIDEMMCYRCGRWSHTIDNCNAITDIYGNRLSKRRKRNIQSSNEK